MSGTVKLINPKRGMVAVQIDDGDFTVFEVLDSCEINIGDEITGNLNSLGSETLYNRTRKERFEAYIEAIHAIPTNAQQLVK